MLCACDLLNEGWDCPEIEVLFMARPTMSRLLYTQQLGRGMRLYQGKESLMVFDFVDNAGQYNITDTMQTEAASRIDRGWATRRRRRIRRRDRG